MRPQLGSRHQVNMPGQVMVISARPTFTLKRGVAPYRLLAGVLSSCAA
jgi:hypothetical protein